MKATIISKLILFLAIFGISLALAQPPNLINYQGKLSDQNGNPITGGRNITFAIYNSETGGNALWEETQQAVTITDGIFHVLLGGVNPFPASLFQDSGMRYLGITVGTDAELSPRFQLTSVPYALKADQADDLSRPFLSSIDGVSNDGGDVDLIAGSNVDIVPDDANNSITISSSGGTGSGDITAVDAGSGLTGGAESGDATLDVGAGIGITVSADTVSLNTTYTDDRYVNEGQANVVNSAMLQDGQVANADLANNAVSSAKIQDGTITNADIAVKTRISNYSQFGNLNGSAKQIANVWTALNTGTKKTFKKNYDDSKIEVYVYSRFGVGGFLIASAVEFQVRVDDKLTSSVSNNGSMIIGENNEFLSMYSVFEDLSAGNHSVSLWAKANFGTATKVEVDPGNLGGKIILKEAW